MGSNLEFNLAQRMMLGIAMGDAFAMTYEMCCDRGMLARNADFTRYKPRRKEGRITRAPGMYTDDTQMSIALAELLAGGKKFNHENLAESFVSSYKRDPITGYSTKSRTVLQNASSGEEFLRLVDSDRTRNGAAMRCVPLGILNRRDEVVRYATINAETTHNTPVGIASSIAVALMSHYHINSIRDTTMYEYIREPIARISGESADHLKAVSEISTGDPAVLFKGENPGREDYMNGAVTAGEVLFILTNFKNPMDMLKQAVLLGGDTDSVASISLGIGLTRAEIGLLPDFLLNDLTNHEFGRDYLIDLGDRLFVSHAHG